LCNLLKRILKYTCSDQSSFSVDGSISVGENEEFLKKGSKPVLLIESTGHALHAFVNQEYQGDLLIDNKFITLYFINQLSLYIHERIVGHYEIQHMQLFSLSSLAIVFSLHVIS